MARYRRVDVRIHFDPKVEALTPIPPCGEGLWHYLLTNPDSTMIPGLARCGRAAMAEALDWPVEAFDKAFGEVFAEGLAEADWKARVVWVPNVIRYDPPGNPNVVRGWQMHWDEIPDCPLKMTAWERLHEWFVEDAEAKSLNSKAGNPKAFLEAFLEACPKPLAKPSGEPLAKPSRMGALRTRTRIQQQEQEQSQEQDSERRESLSTYDPPPTQRAHEHASAREAPPASGPADPPPPVEPPSPAALARRALYAEACALYPEIPKPPDDTPKNTLRVMIGEWAEAMAEREQKIERYIREKSLSKNTVLPFSREPTESGGNGTHSASPDPSDVKLIWSAYCRARHAAESGGDEGSEFRVVPMTKEDGRLIEASITDVRRVYRDWLPVYVYGLPYLAKSDYHVGRSAKHPGMHLDPRDVFRLRPKNTIIELYRARQRDPTQKPPDGEDEKKAGDDDGLLLDLDREAIENQERQARGLRPTL